MDAKSSSPSSRHEQDGSLFSPLSRPQRYDKTDNQHSPRQQQRQIHIDDFKGSRGYCSSEEKQRPSPRSRPSTMPRGSYKPAPLKWPFLVAQIVLLLAAIAAVVAVQKTTPDSDDSAVIDGHPVANRKLMRRDGGDDWDDGGFEVVTMADPPPEDTAIAETTTPASAAGAGVTLTIPDGGSDAGVGFHPAGIPIAGSLSHLPSLTLTPNSRTISGTRTTDPVARWTTAFANADGMPTTVGGSTRRTPTPRLFFGGGLKPTEVIVGATTTTLVVQGETIVAVAGGTTTTSMVVDDGLVAETSTIITELDGSLITLLAITTPGKPLTEVAESVVGGTAITIMPAPVTFVTDVGGGSLVTTVSTPPLFVTTTGGSTATLTRITTPGMRITTNIATTINGALTTVPTVLTTTPTPLTQYQTTSPTGGPNDGSSNSSSRGGDDQNARVVPGFTAAQYFAGAFLPTLVAAVLALPMSIIDSEAKLFQPFHALAQSGGAAGPDAMTLRFSGMAAIVAPVTQLLRGHPVPFVTTLLLGLSRLLAPLAAEAVGFKVHGACSHLSISGCGIAMGVSPVPAGVLVAVMACMVVLLGVLVVLLRRWETGLHSNPWTVAGMASLTLNSRLRRGLLEVGEPSEGDLDDLFRGDRFCLTNFATHIGGEGKYSVEVNDTDITSAKNSSFNCDDSDYNSPYEYGIVPLRGPADDANVHDQRSRRSSIVSAKATPPELGPRQVPFLALTYTGRAIFMVFLLTLIALIVYYHLLTEDNAFELFMDSQAFGVKLLFAALGSAISHFWTSFFTSAVTAAPFMLMSQHPQPASRSILLPRPTNPFTGISVAARQRSPLLVATALLAVAAELLPVLLANIPFALTQTFASHVAGTHASLAVLAAMVLVLALSLRVRWPHMPVDPRSVAGAAYYVAGSGVLSGGLSRMDQEGAERRVRELGRLYFYGRVAGGGGESRMVVDSVDALGASKTTGR